MGGTVHYYVPDWLGTNLVMASATGTTVQESSYYPYGAERRVITSTVTSG